MFAVFLDGLPEDLEAFKSFVRWLGKQIGQLFEVERDRIHPHLEVHVEPVIVHFEDCGNSFIHLFLRITEDYKHSFSD